MFRVYLTENANIFKLLILQENKNNACFIEKCTVIYSLRVFARTSSNTCSRQKLITDKVSAQQIPEQRDGD